MKRPRIAPTWLVLLLAAVVLLTFWSTYPRGGLRERMNANAAPSDLSVAYLEAWLRIQPENEEFLSMLGTQYVHLGRFDDAERIAQRMDQLHTVGMHRDATLLRLKLGEQQAFAIPADDPRRAAALAAVRSHFSEALTLQWGNRDLQWLAESAASVDAPDLSMAFYKRLETQDPADGERWNSQVSRYALFVGNYRQSADAWFRQQDAAKTRDDKRRYFISGLRALQSGNLLDEALAAADQHAGELADDRDTLVFLLNLARAAGRPQLVDRYAKALAKYASAQPDTAGRTDVAALPANGFTYMDGPAPVRSMHAKVGLRGFARDPFVHVVRVAAPVSASAPASAPAVSNAPPAKSNVADLIYQSFLESGDLASAQKTAADQVERDPRSAVWLKRLAQVAEWNHGSPLALKSWVTYSQVTNDPAGWKNVLRLAPMLDDDNAYVAALVTVSNGSPGDMKLVDQVIDAYERLGRPEDALAFLRARRHGAQANAIDQRMGTLAERAGHDDQALVIYRRLQANDPHNPTYALATASVLYRDNDQKGAFEALALAHNYAKDDDVAFWRNYAQLARLLQKDDAANEGYRHLLASGQAEDEDLADMSYFYDPYPIDAGRTSELQYRRDHTPRALQNALYYYVDAGAFDRVAALLASLDDKERAQAEMTPGFLGVRAEYYRLTDRPVDALHDLQKAVSLPNSGSDLRAALLWTLVDYGSDAEVRDALKRWRDQAATTSALWGPFAAAELRLNRPVDALEYLRRESATLSRDPLWLLTYADAQEMAGRPDLAWSIRRTVWREMAKDERVLAAKSRNTRGSLASRTAQDAETQDELRARRVSLSEVYANGDVSKALLQDLIVRDRASRTDTPALRTLLGDAPGLPALPQKQAAKPDDGRLKSAVAKETAIAWALSKESNPLAKRWLARQYADRLAQPADSLLAIALAEENVPEMERLLDRENSRLPMYNRIDATIAVDRPGDAQKLAFHGLDGAPDDTELHTRLVDTTLNWPQAINSYVESWAEHPLSYVETMLGGALKLADHYMIGVTGIQRFQHSADTTQLVNVPHLDRSVEFTARRQTIDTAFEVSAGRREALDSFYTASVEGEWGRNSALQLTARAGHNQTATEDQALQVGGMKDNLIGGFTYRLTNRVFLTGNVEADRFYSQQRNYLGSGILSSGEIGYKIRTEYPDYTVRFVATHGSYGVSGHADTEILSLIPIDTDPTTSDFIPQSYTQYGAFFSFGEDLMQQYTHRWRPFLDIGIVHDSNQGWGPQVDVGFAGSVFGGDHAALYFQHQRVSQRGNSVTVFGARYNWFF